MKEQGARPEILARYSVLRIAAWSVGVIAVSGWIVADSLSRGWRVLEDRIGLLYPAALVAAAMGVIWSLALVINFVRTGGAAIAKVQGEVVFYFPFSRLRIAPGGDMTVFSSTVERPVPPVGAIRWFKNPPVVMAAQVTVARAGKRDINFRTGLLTEKADVIARRLSVALGCKLGL
jgi:hypothetical protein